MPGRQGRRPGGSKNNNSLLETGDGAGLAQETERALSCCLRLLDYRLRTEQELRRTLRRRGISDQAADRCLARLATLGLVNDREFAGSWVRSRMQGSPLGYQALLARLARFGVAQETAREAAAIWCPEAAQIEAAAALVRKRWGGERLEAKQRARLMRFLIGRGFPYSVARQALEHLEPEQA